MQATRRGCECAIALLFEAAARAHWGFCFRSGKWHLGINSVDGKAGKQDRRFTPIAHGYDSYLGAPWTNAPMCAMDGDGVSAKYATGPAFCFLFANDTVVEQPLRLENFTAAITEHALQFTGRHCREIHPWFFTMAYFHVHTPLFTDKRNRGRSRGGAFGDNVEEMDDSVGMIIDQLKRDGCLDNTLVYLTSDNVRPYSLVCAWVRLLRTLPPPAPVSSDFAP